MTTFSVPLSSRILEIYKQTILELGEGCKTDISLEMDEGRVSWEGSWEKMSDALFSTLDVIPVPPQCRISFDSLEPVRTVFGVHGATIKKIKEMSGAFLYGDFKIRSLEISAKSVIVLKSAIQMVRFALKPPRRVIPCLPQYVNKLLMDNGNAIREIRERSGAHIFIDKGKSEIVITGDNADIDFAVKLLGPILSPEAKMEIPVELKFVGLLIGKEGANVKRMQMESGASIFIQSKGTESAVVIIEGDKESVARGHDIVKDALLKFVHPDYSGPFGEEFRDKAKAIAQERSDLFKLSLEYFDRGLIDKAREVQKKVKLKAEELKQANANAAEAIFWHNNPDEHNTLRIDLHGLYVDEAVEALQRRLEMLSDGEPNRTLEVITGAGIHSQKESVLWWSLNRLLTEKGVLFDDMGNGAFSVHL